MRRSIPCLLSVLLVGPLTQSLVGLPAAAAAPAPMAATTSGAAAALAEDTGPGLPSAVPSNTTPWVTDNAVETLTQVGDTTIAGGNFTSVSERGGSPTYNRPNLFAFDSNTGALRNSFAPSVNGEVVAVMPGPTAGTVYIAGSFSQVNGANASHVALLNVNNGSTVNTFKAAATNGAVTGIDRVGNRLYIGGNFTTAAGKVHRGLASLNATTGVLDAFVDVQLTERHNDTGSGAQGAVGAKDLDVTPSGDRMIVIGNFKTADGLARDQVVMVSLDGAAAQVTPDWATNRYTPYCFNWAFDSYVRDVQLSPDGSYFVIGATGGHNDGTLCDTASRFETHASGTDLQPTWANYAGGDTIWGIGITDSVVYVGGHQRWMNNPYGSDYANQGAVPRPGLSALDPTTGVPLDWNPGRNPRGVAAYVVYPTNNGVYVGSNTAWIGNHKYQRPKIAFFPYAGGRPVASTTTGSLPGDVYVAGGAGGNSDVLYRVNAGGPELLSSDSGPDWAGDEGFDGPFRNSGSNTAGWSPVPNVDGTVPASTPAAIFDTERWDPGDAPEMQWDIPVPADTAVDVRLYLANRCDCTNDPGERVFDVSIDGQVKLQDYDIVEAVGDQTGTMRSFSITSDGTVDIDFGHEVENSLINGIEIVRTGSTPSPTDEDVQQIAFDGNDSGAATTLATPGFDWSTVRGAVMIGERVFYGSADGYLYRRNFDGSSFGPAVRIDPYNDPVWSDVDTGSGQTFRGQVPDLYGKFGRLTGMFYASGRLYYTLAGDGNLYWQPFVPDSGIVSPVTSSLSGGFDWSQARGMFAAGDELYIASKADGSLSRMSLVDGVPSGSATVVDSPATGGASWAGRAVFLSTVPGEPQNQAPTARFTSSCTDLTCSFNSTTSSDPEGTTMTRSWDFGDTESSTATNPTHPYDVADTYDVTLTVTDADGASDSVTHQVTVTEPANQAPTARFTSSCTDLSCAFNSTTSSDPEGTTMTRSWDFGDTESSTATNPSHAYDVADTYDVTLTVTDAGGASDSVTHQVTVTEPPGSAVAFVAAAQANRNAKNHTLTVPASAQPGDRLVLMMSLNAASASPATPTGVGSWTSLGTHNAKTMQTVGWTHVVQAGDAGKTLTVVLSTQRKAALTLGVYRGVAGGTPTVTRSVDTTSRSSHSTPTVSAPAGAWVVSYWADKSTNTTSWTTPAQATQRSTTAGSGAGHVSTLLADSNGPVPGGNYGGLAATTNAAAGMATMWSIVLAPAP